VNSKWVIIVAVITGSSGFLFGQHIGKREPRAVMPIEVNTPRILVNRPDPLSPSGRTVTPLEIRESFKPTGEFIAHRPVAQHPLGGPELNNDVWIIDVNGSHFVATKPD